jgi:hypothetical protein
MAPELSRAFSCNACNAPPGKPAIHECDVRRFARRNLGPICSIDEPKEVTDIVDRFRHVRVPGVARFRKN